MSERVKLTQEQAKAIQFALNKTSDYTNDKDRLIRDISRDNVNFHNDLYHLNKIDIAVAAKALYIGYEVKTEFKVGDWVYNNVSKQAAKVIGLNSGYIATDIKTNGGAMLLANSRHATPSEITKEKERRWWGKYGREVWELKKGDSLIESGGRNYPDIIFEVGDFNIHFTDGHFFSKGYIKENYRVFCFAEDRKDVGHA